MFVVDEPSTIGSAGSCAADFTVDLIVGLLESDVGKRQFIISTCDEKLLQLARQKFRHLGDSAVFYRFDAIGPEGPLAEKLSV